MKRFHVHLHVDDLARSIGFYAKLFAAEPARVEADYAKWMLEDPPVNFAISTRGSRPGIDHLGFQTDDPAELASLKARAEAADMAVLDEGQTSCCYARSEKHWVTDPQGIAWEHFHTLGNIPVFSDSQASTAESNSACCAPKAAEPATATALHTEPAANVAASACCAPQVAEPAAACCTPQVAEPAAACCAPQATAPAAASTVPRAPGGKPLSIPVKSSSSSCC